MSSKKIYASFWVLYTIGIFALVFVFYLIAKGKMGYMPSFEELENPKTPKPLQKRIEIIKKII